jgi:hypothetical protein
VFINIRRLEGSGLHANAALLWKKTGSLRVQRYWGLEDSRREREKGVAQWCWFGDGSKNDGRGPRKRVRKDGCGRLKTIDGGAVAQLGARLDGIEEVVGSNPIGSTSFPQRVFMHFHVYILQSESTDRFYIGQRQDLEERLSYHNGNYSKSLKNRGP